MGDDVFNSPLTKQNFQAIKKFGSRTRATPKFFDYYGKALKKGMPVTAYKWRKTDLPVEVVETWSGQKKERGAKKEALAMSPEEGYLFAALAKEDVVNEKDAQTILEDVRAYQKAGFSLLETLEWRGVGFKAEEAQKWAQTLRKSDPRKDQNQTQQGDKPASQKSFWHTLFKKDPDVVAEKRYFSTNVVNVKNWKSFVDTHKDLLNKHLSLASSASDVQIVTALLEKLDTDRATLGLEKAILTPDHASMWIEHQEWMERINKAVFLKDYYGTEFSKKSDREKIAFLKKEMEGPTYSFLGLEKGEKGYTVYQLGRFLGHIGTWHQAILLNKGKIEELFPELAGESGNNTERHLIANLPEVGSKPRGSGFNPIRDLPTFLDEYACLERINKATFLKDYYGTEFSKKSDREKIAFLKKEMEGPTYSFLGLEKGEQGYTVYQLGRFLGCVNKRHDIIQRYRVNINAFDKGLASKTNSDTAHAMINLIVAEEGAEQRSKGEPKEELIGTQDPIRNLPAFLEKWKSKKFEDDSSKTNPGGDSEGTKQRTSSKPIMLRTDEWRTALEALGISADDVERWMTFMYEQTKPFVPSISEKGEIRTEDDIYKVALQELKDLFEAGIRDKYLIAFGNKHKLPIEELQKWKKSETFKGMFSSEADLLQVDPWISFSADVTIAGSYYDCMKKYYPRLSSTQLIQKAKAWREEIGLQNSPLSKKDPTEIEKWLSCVKKYCGTQDPLTFLQDIKETQPQITTREDLEKHLQSIDEIMIKVDEANFLEERQEAIEELPKGRNYPYMNPDSFRTTPVKERVEMITNWNLARSISSGGAKRGSLFAEDPTQQAVPSLLPKISSPSPSSEDRIAVSSLLASTPPKKMHGALLAWQKVGRNTPQTPLKDLVAQMKEDGSSWARVGLEDLEERADFMRKSGIRNFQDLHAWEEALTLPPQKQKGVSDKEASTPEKILMAQGLGLTTPGHVSPYKDLFPQIGGMEGLKAWRESFPSISAQEIREWVSIGYTSPNQILDWKDVLSTNPEKDFKKIQAWIKQGFAPVAAKRWVEVAHVQNPAEAAYYRKEKLEPRHIGALKKSKNFKNASQENIKTYIQYVQREDVRPLLEVKYDMTSMTQLLVKASEEYPTLDKLRIYVEKAQQAIEEAQQAKEKEKRQQKKAQPYAALGVTQQEDIEVYRKAAIPLPILSLFLKDPQIKRKAAADIVTLFQEFSSEASDMWGEAPEKTLVKIMGDQYEAHKIQTEDNQRQTRRDFSAYRRYQVAREWEAAGIEAAEARKWIAAGIEAAEAGKWIAAGIKAAEAGEWREIGVTPEQASVYAEANLPPEIVEHFKGLFPDALDQDFRNLGNTLEEIISRGKGQRIESLALYETCLALYGQEQEGNPFSSPQDALDKIEFAPIYQAFQEAYESHNPGEPIPSYAEIRALIARDRDNDEDKIAMGILRKIMERRAPALEEEEES